MRVVEAIIELQPNINLLTATNGEYGLELAMQYLPDLIILDIHLPGMNGFDILRHLQDTKKTSSIPVIALSADAMPIDIEAGLKAGFLHYITKPIKIDELLNILSEVLNIETPHENKIE